MLSKQIVEPADEDSGCFPDKDNLDQFVPLTSLSAFKGIR